MDPLGRRLRCHSTSLEGEGGRATDVVRDDSAGAMADAMFLYDFNSPYAYLAARRVDDVLPVRPRWQPIAFGAILKETARVPWSFGAGRDAGVAECERRARERGLPPIAWPPGWPRESYSLLPLRAALVAEEHGRLRELSQALFEEIFVSGRALGDLEVVLDAARRAGVPEEAVAAGVQRPEIKERLRTATADALERGVIGVPTVLVGDHVFWGDDRLQDAAGALSAA
jgi:2-hydroxychromene-2-carboxylate isomerase